jgi:hypothetical protein
MSNEEETDSVFTRFEVFKDTKNEGFLLFETDQKRENYTKRKYAKNTRVIQGFINGYSIANGEPNRYVFTRDIYDDKMKKSLYKVKFLKNSMQSNWSLKDTINTDDIEFVIQKNPATPFVHTLVIKNKGWIIASSDSKGELQGVVDGICYIFNIERIKLNFDFQEDEEN